MHTPKFYKKHVALTCKQATLLASRSMDERLTLRERLVLRWHLLICQNCTNYFRQIKLIRKTIRHRQESTAHLSDEARQRIAQAISDAGATINLNDNSEYQFGSTKHHT